MPNTVLILSIFAVCFGSSFLMGYNLAVVNIPEKYITSFLNKTVSNQISNPVKYAAVSGFYVLFAAIGSFSCGMIADHFGRRNSLMANHGLGIIGGVLSAISVRFNSAALLYIGRAISGVNGGITIGIASMYLTEIAPSNQRGFIGACHQLAVTLGIFVSYLVNLTQINSEMYWSIGLGLGAIPPTIACFILPFCPESARYLFVHKENEAKARVAFERVNTTEAVDGFISELQIEMEAAKKQPKFKFVQLFKQKDLRMPIIIAVTIQILQQLSGINAVVANSSNMLNTAGVDVSTIKYFVVSYGALNVICTIVALPLLEKLGRRTLLIWPTFVLGVTLLLTTIFVETAEITDNKKLFGIITSVLIYVYIVCFAVGLGTVPALIVSELFRQGPRGAAYSLSQGIQWSCNFLVLSTYPSLNDRIKGYTFLIYLSVVTVCWLFFFLCMPETKNRTFDSIATDLASGFVLRKKRKSPSRTDRVAMN